MNAILKKWLLENENITTRINNLDFDRLRMIAKFSIKNISLSDLFYQRQWTTL